jgi:hypothetical protein
MYPYQGQQQIHSAFYQMLYKAFSLSYFDFGFVADC